MIIRKIILIFIALILSGGTAFLAKSWLDANKRPHQSAQSVATSPQREVEILIAKADIPLGKFVTESDFIWQEWPEDYASDHHLIKDNFKIETLNGQVARKEISAGEPVNIQKFIRPGERGFLAAVLKPGHRALSIPISEETGINGLVFPGDRVDLIASMTIKEDEDKKARKRHASETVMTNVRVLALGTTLNTPEGETNKGSKTVTVELKPNQVEIIAVAKVYGKISLSLRPLAKNEDELQELIETGNIEADESPAKGDSFTWDYEATQVFRFGGGSTGESLVISRGNTSVKVGGE
ncbi:Flp pilus assembly protein CpaB [Kiloniella sp. EL199]|uniref:Flp pilus assembly protein CpaB n=1 Tax=Kiloniella sp. EL199 TaxID=2107581 RepID=UPI000EA3E40F|nr:Flp pilus assembly protein CpaB [Kiloniella sp. EL199]